LDLETKEVVRKQSSQSPFHLAISCLVSDVPRYNFKNPAITAGNLVHVTFITTLGALMSANTTLITKIHAKTTTTIFRQAAGFAGAFLY
jgi:hypothetical protein